jgi:hypothetical protein
MPVIRNPGTLTAGHGKVAPDENKPRPALEGAGLAGAGPNIGQVDPAIESLPGGVATESVYSHIVDGDAHKASSISIDGHPDTLISGTVEGALDELIGTVMKQPPALGQWSQELGEAFMGIPDWGFLKLRDSDLSEFTGSGVTYTDPTVQTAQNVYPYLLTVTGPPRDTEFGNGMTDPGPDWTFNTGMEGLGEPGMGVGRCHIGGYTRDGDVGPAPLPVFRSARLYPRPTGVDATTGRPARVPVTISGTLFPADRGVLALLHFAPNITGTVKVDFLAQPLISDETAPLSAQGRVVAALLLGGGILGSKCDDFFNPCDDPAACDGKPGGIFGKGRAYEGGPYDPFGFPGRAPGQYGLKEIHDGVNAAAELLRAPWDDFDGDTVTGTSRTVTDVIPAPGQVRLGTDPHAGETPVGNGIPILGGTTAPFAVPPTPQNGSLTLNIHGDAIVEDSNFFRYRLPVLKDYSPTSGLKWTPRGEDPLLTSETNRYFAQAAPANTTTYADGTAVGSTWRTAGLYTGFDEDYWVWQIARYRQTFLMQSIELDGDREEPGTYMLIHFMSEVDFERCVRDGEFPWDVADPYEVYGIAAADSPESDENLANPWPAATVPISPDGPAPDYGYAANPWHNVRNRVFMDPAGLVLPAVSSSAFTWTTAAAPATNAIVWVSGVAYFTPRQYVSGASSFNLTASDITIGAGFWTSFRTDYLDLTAWPSTGPALVASQNPVMVATAPWGYDVDPTTVLPSSLTVPVGGAGVGYIPSLDYQLPYRLEMPFTHLGTNAGGVFTNANGPLDADTLVLALPSGIELLGDDENPSFSRNAVMRAHFRRPLDHIAADSTNLPFAAADGHGQLLTHTLVGTVLMHTSRFNQTGLTGSFGNFLVGATGAPPNTSYVGLNDTLKDYTERFLDETHRYTQVAPAALNGHGPYTAATITHLDGPGMGGWAGGPIETPVRISLANTPWDEASYLLMEDHLVDLTGTSGLQVAGLPDRNPPISDVNTMPYPSAGVLIYPKTDFSAGHFPVTVTHMTPAQPDYSAAAGGRYYLRTLDAAFSNVVGATSVAGNTELVLRFDGIVLEDFEYTAPGPGGMGSSKLAILLKVPGLTTWMDVGRADGGGPGKQDPLLDGAGCLVAGAETYNFTDPATGYKGCYVKCHVGPVASLFTNPAAFSGYTVGSPAGEAPVQVTVAMNATAVDYDLEHRYVTGSFEVASKPGGESDLVRGLFTMRVVHPTDTLISAD